MGNVQKASLKGKTIIITGANSGLGFEAAKKIALNEANVILGCRNAEKGIAAQQAIQQQLRAANLDEKNVKYVPLNLGSLKSVKDFATQMKQENEVINGIINNAAVAQLPQYETTEDGYEAQFQINYLGHYLLNQLLLDSLKKPVQAQATEGKTVLDNRILHIICRNYSMIDSNLFNPKFMNDKEYYHPAVNYAQSKAALAMYARALADELKAAGCTTCTSNLLDPGLFNTKLMDHIPDGMRKKFIGAAIMMGVIKEPSVGGEIYLQMMSSPALNGVSGKCFVKQASKPSPAAGIVFDYEKRDQLLTYSQQAVEKYLS